MKKTNIQNMRFMCDLKNKNSLIYSELIKAIDIFNKGIPYYFTIN